jgi:putative membrane protein
MLYVICSKLYATGFLVDFQAKNGYIIYMLGKSFIGAIIASILGLYLATLFVPGVYIDGSGGQIWKSLALAGLVLGFLHIFIKPIIDLITLPLRILTLGLVGLVINIAMVEIVDILFPSIHIKGFVALLFASLIIFAIDLIISFIIKIKKK